MKRQRHSEEQIIAVLQKAQAGATIEELCRRHGISQGTYYKWRQRRLYGFFRRFLRHQRLLRHASLWSQFGLAISSPKLSSKCADAMNQRDMNIWKR